jgi:membrane protein DedA with SNARE-associated domain/rhodanese-related sulfurtransferase
MTTLISLTLEHGVLLVFLVTLAARAGAPLPASPLLVVAGGVAQAGQLSLAAVLVVAVVANVLGDALWFYAGRRFGHRVLGLLCRISMSPDSCVRQSEALVTRWGGSALVAAKFLPGVSVVAAPMAGALGMSVRRFVAYDVLAGLVWAAVFLGLGMVFSDQIEGLLAMLANAGLAAGAVLLLAIGAFIAWRYLRRRRFLRRTAMARISVGELDALLASGAQPVIIDVRSLDAATADPRRIPGARLVGLTEMEQHAPQLPLDREIVLYCNCPNEASAAMAASVLSAWGLRRVRPLTGGIDAWEAAGLPVALA